MDNMVRDIKADAMLTYNVASIQVPDEIAFCASEFEVICIISSSHMKQSQYVVAIKMSSVERAIQVQHDL
eukprot:12652110-Ditylum_brightwellii.AAC.1